MKKEYKKSPIITFVANSGTGKTTILEKLIPLLKKRGLIIAVIKHDAHRFEIDYPGKDSYRFAQSGADVVAISSAEKVAFIEKCRHKLTIEEVIDRLPPVDLILTEGYKKSVYPKIEIHRRAVSSSTLLCRPDECLAVMTDEMLDISIPCFSLDDIDLLAELIYEYTMNYIAEE
ncbi:molybdopterin-guanine dinucleotide biosynthesis protein B [Clostridium estertheticum]|uniref:molybdopterin-guanine dinucleotide biosynthesis protein B n=1 Tax=Clostridium estertheticum TaxID=238834 RepID=UPI001C0C7ECC|nr:molybdopterin-guanine dinucleotide biosynthesis protein B [Clostridium estertheticum]MBU3214676.1 molybdopterin-guanine dinucleotide biosynthesis protein B [Clostridium estertheticum]WAG57089.1 molybdopterin-guanine dinucleotide biosynthesis protein B [Clostridium estertheticum]